MTDPLIELQNAIFEKKELRQEAVEAVVAELANLRRDHKNTAAKLNSALSLVHDDPDFSRDELLRRLQE